MIDLKAITEPLKRLAALMKADKRIELLVYALLAILGIFLYTASCGKNQEGGAEAGLQEAASQAPAETAVEDRLAETLSCIRGAGKVRVMITYDTGTQIVPAMSTDVQSSTSESTAEDGTTLNENRTESSRPATLQDEALVITEKAPAVRGVIVIAEGAADIAVKLKLQAAVQTVLGVDIDCIEVFEMSRTESE
ncbi:MAG: hypothetical protein VB049_04790 [Candidatus Pelethousia sp.]|nr:hypothetical protein [Candidatus Pelethousia sp.]